MAEFPPAMQKLIAEFSRLPSIGEKSATRLAYYLLNTKRELAVTLADSLKKAVESVRLCDRCFFLTDETRCAICRNAGRDASLLCVVEKPMDVVAVERTGEYNGYYHVLHGLWAPLRGQGPESLKLKELMDRLKEGVVKEVILATGATVEGDATAIYVARLVGELGIKCSRLAQGMPKGGELEYADEITLSRAFSGRSKIGG